jgi:endonuclease YncB( thermonuclease family)
MPHDFKNFPELTNAQAHFYYFQSPHKQIFEDFSATVVRVHDGDTITVRWQERDFDFPIRFADTAAPELNEDGGHEAQSWLENRILGKEVDIIIDQNKRVEKWGRLLGTVLQGGQDVGHEEIMNGFATTWENRKEGKIEFKLPEI